jgi:hypothetical protein
MPDSATGTFAERWGKIFGTRRKGATPARKTDAYRVIGVPTTPVTEGTELRALPPPDCASRSARTTWLAPMTATAPVTLTSTSWRSTWARRRDSRRARCSSSSRRRAGSRHAASCSSIADDDGFDIEQESSRSNAAHLKAAGEPSAGGNDADYIRWQEAIEGIDQAFVYPNRAGRGTVDVIALHAGSGSDRVLSEAEADEVIAALEELAPTQVVAPGGSLRHLTAIPDEQPIELTIEPNGDAEWEFDWVDETPPVVDDWDSVTRVLTFAADRPDSMKAGDRMCIHGVASDQTGEVLIIESLVGDDAVLEESPRSTPSPPTSFMRAVRHRDDPRRTRSRPATSLRWRRRPHPGVRPKRRTRTSSISRFRRGHVSATRWQWRVRVRRFASLEAGDVFARRGTQQ